jgi:DNA-directed RNA polymerase specialized sigma24 family protein
LLAEHGEDLYPSAISSAQESELLLRQLWKQLPDELLQIGVYYFVDGMTHGEIANVLDVSRRTVGNRLKELEELARRKTGGGDD